MTAGRVEFPSIQGGGQILKPIDPATNISEVRDETRSTKSRVVVLDSTLSRLPATISDGQNAGATCAYNIGDLSRPPGRRRMSTQSMTRSIKRTPFIRRTSGQNVFVSSQLSNTSNSPTVMQRAVARFNSGEPQRRRNLRRSSSFRLKALHELAQQNEAISDVYDESLYARRISNFSDGTVDIVNSYSVDRPKPKSLSKQMSLLNLGGRKGSSTNSRSLGRRRSSVSRSHVSRTRRSSSLRRRSGSSSRESSHDSPRDGRRFGRGRSRHLLNVQLMAIPASPNLSSDRFRKAVRLLQMVMRSFQISRRMFIFISRYKNDQTADSICLGGPPSPQNKSGLFFDRNHYKAKKEGQLSAEVKRIMTKEVEDRTPEEINKALICLRSVLDTFCEFPIKMQEAMAKFGWYNSLEKRRVIIRQGHRAENFYLMLSGTALVTTTTIDQGTNQARVRLVNFLRLGSSFGEKELLMNESRPHTVICQDEVEVLTIDKETYVNIFMQKNDREDGGDNDLQSFMKTIEAFQDWPVEKLPKNNPTVCMLAYFRRGAVVCRNSNQSEWIYVIKSGACDVLKQLKEPRIQSPTPRLTNTRGQKRASPTKAPPPTRVNLRSRAKLPPIITVSEHSDVESLAESVAKSAESSRGNSASKRFANAARKVFSTELYQNKPKTSNADVLEAEEPISLLDSLEARSHSPRLAEVATTLMASFLSDKTSEGSKDRKSVFVRLHRCQAGDVFGLASLFFKLSGGSPSLTLTSDGAECILISRSFFLQHLSGLARDRLVRTVPPWPPKARLQELLQEQADWETYKSHTLGDVVQFKKKVSEGSI
ncbi:uncharacterized protein [Diadema antillarum]|uniref:uncharacterized protein n=1 Tax=Diadema antillarum TaxID=105358 RepID=UPI003A854231